MWYVYILECADRTFYSGITTDPERRTKEHNVSARGAKYTRGRRPVKLKYLRAYGDKSQAAREECRIKGLARSEKVRLIKLFRQGKVKKTTPIPSGRFLR